MPDSILSGVFALAGAAMGGLFGYGSAIASTIRKERNQAAIEFQTVFLNTLLKIDPLMIFYQSVLAFTEMRLVNILKEDFPVHVMAYTKFRQYLTEEKKTKFDAAWAEYCQEKTEDGKTYVHLGKYFNPAAYADHMKERDEAIKNIRAILSFAELNHKSPFESNVP